MAVELEVESGSRHWPLPPSPTYKTADPTAPDSAPPHDEPAASLAAPDGISSHLTQPSPPAAADCHPSSRSIPSPPRLLLTPRLVPGDGGPAGRRVAGAGTGPRRGRARRGSAHRVPLPPHRRGAAAPLPPPQGARVPAPRRHHPRRRPRPPPPVGPPAPTRYRTVPTRSPPRPALLLPLI